MSRTLIDEAVDAGSLSPYLDNVILKIVAREKTSGGIYLPGNKATPIVLGKVLAVGKRIPNNATGRDFPVNIEPGSHVIFMDYAGERVRIAWEDYRIIREHGIWASVIPGTDDVHNFQDVVPRMNIILLRPDSSEKTRSGTLFLPNQDLAIAYHTGTVIKTGPGLWHLESGKRIPCGVSDGERVVFRRYAGAEIMVKGETLRILQEEDIISGITED